jgi:hypothetical protein
MRDILRTGDIESSVTQLNFMLANKQLLSPHYLYRLFSTITGYGTASGSAASG